MTTNLLILDVDETLIHGRDPSGTHPDPPPPRVDFKTCGRFQVMKRPHVDDFLRWCFGQDLFEVAVWSAAGEFHVRDVLNHLLLPSERDRLKFVFTGNRCTTHWVDPDDWAGGDRFLSLKDLKKVRRLGWDLNRVLALDDTYPIYRRSYSNLVHIRPFRGEETDEELLRVQPFLEKWFSNPKGVRHIEKRFWNRS